MLVFRGKLLAGLRRAVCSGELSLPADHSAARVLSLLNQLGRKAWVVHCCQRYAHGRGVTKYLARYVRGGPLRNQQLVQITDTHVRFRYQSHQTGRSEVATLSITTFLQRWLEHVPQRGKASMRYFGLYSSGARVKLNAARGLLQQAPVSQEALLRWQAYLAQRDHQPACEICGEPLHHQDKEREAREAA